MVDFETVELRVQGRVQGVGFRASALRHAHLYSVKGWVSNAANGSVELVLQGSTDAIDQMVSWLHIGPEQALVEQVEIRRSYTDKRYDFFDIR